MPGYKPKGKKKKKKMKLVSKIEPPKCMDRVGDSDTHDHSRIHPTSDSPEISTDRNSLILQDLKMFSNSTERIESDDLGLAIALAAFIHFKLPERVKMLHLVDLFNKTELDIWNKSPGLPWSELGYSTVGDIQNDQEAIRRVRHFWHRVKLGENVQFPDCCVSSHSHMCEGNESKVSLDLLYPATITCGEAIFAVPLLDGFKEILESYVGLDFKEFDKTVPAWLINIAFDILCLNINFAYWQNEGVPDARRMVAVYVALHNYFINTKVKLSDGRSFQKNTGIPSGSLFAPLIRTICNAIITNYISLKLSGTSTKFGFFPDFTKLLLVPEDLDRIARRHAKELGMSLNSKTCGSLLLQHRQRCIDQSSEFFTTEMNIVRQRLQ